jgi:hypothetical protein
MSKGQVNGKLVVFLLFGGALLLWAIVFMTGYRQKLANQTAIEAGSRPHRDTVVTPDTVRALLARLPSEWLKVTPVEGQGFVIFVPCYSSNSRLLLKPSGDTAVHALAGRPLLSCEYCDSLDDFAVQGIGTAPGDSVIDLVLAPAAGNVSIIPVKDTLLQKFPEAPFRDRLLLWIRAQGVDSTGKPSLDTMFFVPKSEESEFEVLRAEDENPEGCGEDTGD